MCEDDCSERVMVTTEGEGDYKSEGEEVVSGNMRVRVKM